MTLDEIRAVIAEEIDVALAPVREAIARLGNFHGKSEHEEAAHNAGVAAARRTILRRQAKARADCGSGEKVEEEVVEAEATKDTPTQESEAPPAPHRAPPPRFKAPECSECEGPMISDDNGLRCPKCDA